MSLKFAPGIIPGATVEAVAPLTRRVWDLPVRIFHWVLVLAMTGAYVTHRVGVEAFPYHVWCGYTVIVLVAFRLIWGVVGTRHAQFGNFVRNPGVMLRYLAAMLRGEHERFAGHNPLGAVMVVALLIALALQALCGLFGNDEIFNFGPLYGYVSKARSLQLTSFHRKLFYWIAGAVAVHVLAVLWHRWRYREALVTAMFTGRKPAGLVAAAEEITSSRLWLATFIVVAVIVVLTWVIRAAPQPAGNFF